MSETEKEPEKRWVMLEIFGHRVHWGLLSEVEQFGAKQARIDEYGIGDEEPRATHFYGGSAIFSITPVTEETARKRYDYIHPKTAVQSLPPPAAENHYEDYSYEDECQT